MSINFNEINNYELNNLINQYINLLGQTEDKEYVSQVAENLLNRTSAISSKAYNGENIKEDIAMIDDLIFDKLEGHTGDNAVSLKKIKSAIKNLLNKCSEIEEDNAQRYKKLKLSDISLNSVSETSKHGLKRKEMETEPTTSADTTYRKELSDIVNQYIALIESRSIDDPEIKDEDALIKFHLESIAKGELQSENIITMEKFINSTVEEGLDTGELGEIKTRINNIVKQLEEDTKEICENVSSTKLQKKSDEVLPNLPPNGLPENLAELVGLYAIDPDDIIDKLERGDEIDQFDKGVAAMVLELDLNSYKTGIKDIGKVLELFHNVKKLTMPRHADDSDLDAVAKLTNLVALDLYNCGDIHFSNLNSIAALTSLQELRLGSYSVNTTLIASLAALKSLHNLSLKCCQNIDDTSLAHLATFKYLKTLHLFDCYEITDTGLASIATLESLQNLHLPLCGQITDIGLASIATLKSLQYLDLSYCSNIDDTSLAHLATFKPLLKTLNLICCHKITNTGLASIATLKSLQNLNLIGCAKITDAGIALVIKANPSCKIER